MRGFLSSLSVTFASALVIADTYNLAYVYCQVLSQGFARWRCKGETVRTHFVVGRFVDLRVGAIRTVRIVLALIHFLYPFHCVHISGILCLELL